MTNDDKSVRHSSVLTPTQASGTTAAGVSRMQEKATPDNPEAIESTPTILLLCTDLMFGVQLQNMVKRAGLRFTTVRPGQPLPPAALMVVDLAARADVLPTIREAASEGIP